MPATKPMPLPPSSPDEVEQQFYDGLRRGDLELLMAVWSDDDDISCVHPGGSRALGPVEIRQTFAHLFAGGAALHVHAEQVHRMHNHACAVHSVLERVQSGTRGNDIQVAWVLATNVYVLTPLGWRMVAHHASAGPPREMPDFVATASSALH